MAVSRSLRRSGSSLPLGFFTMTLMNSIPTGFDHCRLRLSFVVPSQRHPEKGKHKQGERGEDETRLRMMRFITPSAVSVAICMEHKRLERAKFCDAVSWRIIACTLSLCIRTTHQTYKLRCMRTEDARPTKPPTNQPEQRNRNQRARKTMGEERK